MNIGFYSGSTPITVISPKRFKRAENFLSSKGVQLIAGSLTGKSDGYRSGSIKDRAEEINELIHNSQVDTIMSTIGGTNTNSVLPYIDYDYLQKHPKTFVGYSDATALLLAVKTQSPNCRVLYGPALVASFGEWPPFVEKTWQYFKQVVDMDNKRPLTLKAPLTWSDESANWEDFDHDKKEKENCWHFINEPILKGRIVGGNLNTMYGIIASKYFPKFESTDILFIEDSEKNASTVEKNFVMLKDAGIFDQVRGIVLGKHALFNDENSQKRPVNILQEVLDDPQMPIIYDYDSCHTIPMVTTPIGEEAIIDANKKQVTFIK